MMSGTLSRHALFEIQFHYTTIGGEEVKLQILSSTKIQINICCTAAVFRLDGSPGKD